MAAVLLILFVSMLSYLVWFEKPWLSYPNDPFPPEKMQLKRGDPIVLKVERCSTATVNRSYGLSRRLECNETSTGALKTIAIAPGTKDMAPGCYAIISKDLLVPQETPIGWCRLYSVAETQGVVRSHSVESESKLFEVIE